MPSSQLALDWPTKYAVDEDWDRLLPIVRGYSDEMTFGVAAALVDAAPSTFGNAMNERGEHSPRMRWLCGFTRWAAKRRRYEIPLLFADIADVNIVNGVAEPRRALTEDEKNRAIVEEMRAEAPGLVKRAEERVLGVRR